MVGEGLFEQLWRLEDILLRQDPGSPVDAHGPFTFGVPEDLDGVPGVGVHGAHDPPGHVGADGDEAEVERPLEVPYVFESWTVGEIGVFFGPVVFTLTFFGDGPVPRIAAKVDAPPARTDGPRRPEGRGAVVDTP